MADKQSPCRIFYGLQSLARLYWLGSGLVGEISRMTGRGARRLSRRAAGLRGKDTTVVPSLALRTGLAVLVLDFTLLSHNGTCSVAVLFRCGNRNMGNLHSTHVDSLDCRGNGESRSTVPTTLTASRAASATTDVISKLPLGSPKSYD